MRIVAALAFVCGLFLLGGEAAAGEVETAKRQVVYQKHQVVVFGDHLLSADVTRPDGEYVKSQKEKKWRNLIMVRQNWRKEILQSLR